VGPAGDVGLNLSIAMRHDTIKASGKFASIHILPLRLAMAAEGKKDDAVLIPFPAEIIQSPSIAMSWHLFQACFKR